MIPSPEQPKVVVEEKNRGVYEIEGLYPGYGHTLGNALRRVLLSSLRGAVVTAVKIEGVNHEFSTIPGVKEDVVDVCLNLKQARFRFSGETPVTGTISVKGEKEVRAGDIKISSDAEAVNPDLVIATLTDKKSVLQMELEISSGLGYQGVQDREKQKVEIGKIALDASFSPVRSVNYEVENMRVGDRTDYNLLRIHIATDGSIEPRVAFTEAAKILTEQFQSLSGVFMMKEKERGDREGDAADSEIEESYEDTIAKKKAEELDLSTRTLNALVEAGIKTVGGIMRRTEKKLLEVEGLGEKGIVEIKKALGNLGVTLKQ
jgi:DNA-directed RNA polymerase subunit alpha